MPPSPHPDQLKVLSRPSVLERLAPKIVETTLVEPTIIKTKRWSHGVLGHHPEKIAKVISPSHVQSTSFVQVSPSESRVCIQQRLATPPHSDDQQVSIVKGNRHFRNDADIQRYNRWYRNQTGGLHATPPPLQKIDIDEGFRQSPRGTDLPWFSPVSYPIKVETTVLNDPFNELAFDLTNDDD